MQELVNLEKRQSNRNSPIKQGLQRDDPAQTGLLRHEESDAEQLLRKRRKDTRKRTDEELPKRPTVKYEINLENYEKYQDYTNDKIDPRGVPGGSLLASFGGYIQTVQVFIALMQMFEDTDLQANYQLHWGEQWREEYMNPSTSKGASQFCETRNSKITFNLPFQCTLSSIGVGEWPQIVVVFKGFDFFGRKITKGYAQMHFPVASGTHTYTANIYAPEPSFLQWLNAWFSGTSIEYKRDFQKIILKGEGRSIGRIRTVGRVTIVFNVTLRNFERLGYK